MSLDPDLRRTWLFGPGADTVVHARMAACGADVLILDLMMPELSGTEVASRVRSDPKTSHIPIIMVTTKDQETDRVWGKRQGARDYLTKPVDEALLMQVIANLIPGK